MRRGGGRLPVLAQIAGPGEERRWALRRGDFDALGELLPRLDGHRAVLVTGGGEEAASLAVALAGVGAASGRRSALLECDLARPRLAAELGLDPAPGLHEYLRWEATPPEVLQPLTLAGSAAAGAAEPLVCIAAGRPAGDAATLLALRSFAHMAAKLRDAYELLVLAGPPLGPAAGSLPALAAGADAVLVALPAGGDGRRARRAARRAVRALPAPPLGAVIVGAGGAQRS